MNSLIEFNSASHIPNKIRVEAILAEMLAGIVDLHEALQGEPFRIPAVLERLEQAAKRIPEISAILNPPRPSLLKRWFSK